MKKIISVLLTVCLLLSAFSLSLTAEAAAKPARVTVTSAVIHNHHDREEIYLKVKWKKVKGAKGYQIAFGDRDWEDGTLSYNLKKTVKGGSKTSYKLNMMYSSGESYARVKVRAYKIKNGKKIYGKWSKAKNVKYKEYGSP